MKLFFREERNLVDGRVDQTDLCELSGQERDILFQRGRGN